MTLGGSFHGGDNMQNNVQKFERKIRVRIGTAGWSIPANNRSEFSQSGSLLEKYATRFNAVEINSSFYRPHTRRTYEKWASEVAADFSFSVKLPKSITHLSKLKDIDDLANQFAAEISGLGDKLGCVLVQLPPGLEFSLVHARRSFTLLRKLLRCHIVCEPRHRTWFTSQVDAFLIDADVARVAADPALCVSSSVPGGALHICYYRLHGSPHMYYSDYSARDLEGYAKSITELAQRAEVWCIFDNTANGWAFSNALWLQQLTS